MCGAMKPVSLLFDQPTYVKMTAKIIRYSICKCRIIDSFLEIYLKKIQKKEEKAVAYEMIIILLNICNLYQHFHAGQ